MNTVDLGSAKLRGTSALVAGALFLCACAGAPAKDFQHRALSRTFGPVSVVEHRSPMAIPATVLLTRTQEMKELVESLLKGLYPEKMGVSLEPELFEVLPDIGPDSINVYTVDENVDTALRLDEEQRSKNSAYPFPKKNREERLAEIARDMGESQILVLRYRDKP